MRRDWFTPNEVGEMLGVQGQTVRWWILTGKLDGELASKNTYLVHESAIADFCARRHGDDTPSADRGGDAGNRSPVRKPIDPAKRYRLPTGEVVTGAEVLRRRSEA
jgi:predicted site-specific integrase-resolvase